MRALLDVNFLVALFDEDHVFNDPAHTWLEAHAANGIATCPLTENGLVRVLSHPAYSKLLSVSPGRVVRMLSAFLDRHDHAFWADDLSLRAADRILVDSLLGHRQVTDVYLLALAVAHGGCLVTFDKAVATDAVSGFRAQNIVVV